MSESFISVVSRIAGLTTCTLEDNIGNKHPGVSGMVTFGPIRLDSDRNSNGYTFGVDIDQHFREAGWALVGKNGSSGGISWTLLRPPDQHTAVDPRTGATVYPEDAPLFEQHWLIDDGGDNVFTYNSNTFSFIGFPWEKGGAALGLGVTAKTTTDIIAEAMGGQGFSPEDWTGINYYWLTFPVDDFGSLANERFFSSNGFFSVSENRRGAGKIWESQPLGTGLNQMKLRISFSLTGTDYDGNITITITALKNTLNDGFVKQGKSYVIPMMAQPDYVFMMDPYSFCMFSLKSTFHADLYQTTYLFATMINSEPAMPQHTSLPPIPKVAIVTSELGEILMMGIPGRTMWRSPDISVDGSITPESGVSFQFIRNNPGPLLNNDDSDVIDAAKALISMDNAGTGNTSTGPMQWMGNLWNAISMQRDMRPIFNPWVPDTAVIGEELLPKTYHAIKFQNGAEETFVFNGTQGSILLASADYSILAPFNNEQPNQITGYTAPGIRITSESNLFSPIHAEAGATVSIQVQGGRPRVWDVLDPSNNRPSRFVITAVGLPADGSWRFHQDSDHGAHLESTSPGSVGAWPVTISATDTFGNSVNLLYNLVVGPATVLLWSNDGLPNGTAGKPYFMQGGGDDDTTWSLVSGILPTGMFFEDQTGTLSGTPNSAGLYDFAISIVTPSFSVVRDYHLTIQ